MGKQIAAVLGTGQTRHASRRTDVSMAGLCREAVDRAMADAEVGWDEVDAVVVGKAPDLFEGVMMPELVLADALGATGKPLLRVHTAGSVGGSTANVAASLVQAGVHRRVLAVAFEKQSESNAMWALSIMPPFSMPVGAGAGGYFAPHVRSYIRRSGAPPHIGAMVAVKDRRNGSRNPWAHVRQADLTVESVLASQMLWDPIRYDETCPSSDGACAMVLGDEHAAAGPRPPGGGGPPPARGPPPPPPPRPAPGGPPARGGAAGGRGAGSPRGGGAPRGGGGGGGGGGAPPPPPAAAATGRPVAWIHATAMRTEPTTFAGRDQVSPQAGRDAAAALWAQGGINDPMSEVDVAELYVPFSWFEPMWLENLGFAAEGEGWKLTESGETAIGGRLPVNPSGGVLSSNPIGASGMLRFAEAAMQVMGRAGEHQVDGARTALGHAYGGGSQYFSMWVVGAARPGER
ncbi:thiolase domain-containing protein [Saccharopolyspora sp. 6M]|uniref:thiolase domain-containing protein n=1 Tax=Saccharopolyspora sp. 6M TaxID=2877237 RepID=UPI001CD55F2D|nr:thiolase domain-containing protein [Saccharopolyspora sp. 6M]MCA1227154.1 thiolase domain-containing protein [Saccharopolyspora sp. 6M]